MEVFLNNNRDIPWDIICCNDNADDELIKIEAYVKHSGRYLSIQCYKNDGTMFYWTPGGAGMHPHFYGELVIGE